MSSSPEQRPAPRSRATFAQQLRERGVLRVAVSYAIIAWLTLQIADVTFEPFSVPNWVMITLIVAAILGFPIALLLAWFLEITPQGVAPDTAPAGVARPGVHGARRYADVLIIVVLLVAVAVLLVRERGWDRPPPPAHPAIAVLPFINESGRSEDDYFSDGVSEELLDRLSRVPGLRVAARSSSFQLRAAEPDARRVADKLGVTSILTGGIRRSGTGLRMWAELIDGATGRRVWSGSYERRATELFAIQQEVVRHVAAALLPDALERMTTQRAPTVSIDAHDLYLLGRSLQVKRGLRPLEKSAQLFEQAIDLDPNYALAHTGLANSLLLLASSFEREEQDEHWRRAEAAIYRALAIDPQLSEAHGAHANLLRDRKRAGAEDEYRRAIELNPNNAIALHDYSVYVSNEQHGREAEVFALQERAVEIDPLHVNAWLNLMSGYLFNGVPARYATIRDRNLARFDDEPEALRRLTFGLLLLGDPEHGAAGSKRLLELLPVDQPRFPAVGIARTYCMLDDLETCEKVLQYAAAGPRTEELDMLLGWLDLDLAGLKRQYEQIPAMAQALPVPCFSDDREADRHAVQGFWLAIEGRYARAHEHLRQAGPVESLNESAPLGFCSRSTGLLPAAILTYRAVGERAMAEDLAKRYREELMQALATAPGNYQSLVMLAALDAVVGRKNEAVSGLRRALDAVPYPTLFIPTMPWFSLLEGTPGYAAVLQERERRRQAILARIGAPPG